MTQHGQQPGYRPESEQQVGAGSPSRHANPTPDPLRAGDDAARLTTLAHELANILDGSLRSLQIALRSIPAGGAIATAVAPTEDDLRARLAVVEQSLLRMSDLIRRVSSPSLSAHALANASLLEALRHAAEVSRASIRAEVHGPRVTIEDRLDPGLAGARSGEIYAVALNALRNALDAMSRRTDRLAPGQIVITAGYIAPGMIRLEVVDNGPGLDPSLDPAHAARLGVSTKPGSAGVGLALTARIVTSMGGRFALAPHTAGGAVFVAEFPEPRDWGSITLGGGAVADKDGRCD